MKLFLCTLSLFFFFFLLAPICGVHAQTPAVQPTKIKILLVPGHDSETWGAQYGNLKEADMNLALATQIFNALKKDKKYEVHITRDAKGYTKEFADYFTNNKDQISEFITSAKERMQGSIAAGAFVENKNTPHGTANDRTVQILYGINKWANENKMDAVIHVHFNDYARKTKWIAGDRKGFAIYIPDQQFVNSGPSYDLANEIFYELKKKYATSNYVNELGGMIFDHKLIAIGANRTLVSSVRSVLVEYGYIYRFGNSALRQKAYQDMSALTVAGIKDYFTKLSSAQNL